MIDVSGAPLVAIGTGLPATATATAATATATGGTVDTRDLTDEVTVSTSDILFNGLLDRLSGDRVADADQLLLGYCLVSPRLLPGTVSGGDVSSGENPASCIEPGLPLNSPPDCAALLETLDPDLESD